MIEALGMTELWIAIYSVLYVVMGVLWALLDDANKPVEQQNSWIASVCRCFDQRGDRRVWVLWCFLLWCGALWPIGRYALWALWGSMRLLRVKGY